MRSDYVAALKPGATGSDTERHEASQNGVDRGDSGRLDGLL
jgi:hypothetical protein